MQKKKLSFIILQYNTPKETLECVNSIQNSLKNEKEYSIIVVDNKSSDENLKLFEKVFKTKKNVDIIKNPENYGFSKGNNIGFEFAKENYDSDFYYIINNDTIISQPNTIELIEKEYKKSKFDVLGPDIINLKGEHTNPCKYDLSKKALLKRNLRWHCRLFLNYLNLYEIAHNLLKKKIIKNKNNKRKNCSDFYGAALIFQKRAFEKLKCPFDPETFIYEEELILSQNIRKHHLKGIYSPKIKILHKEGKSSNYQKRSRKREIIKTKNLIKSLKVLNKFIKNPPLEKDKHIVK